MKKSQIAVEHLLLVTLAILIIVPSILVYQNYIAHDPTKDNAIAAKLANDITDEVSSMIRLGSGWQTFTFDAPESVKRIDAKGNELLVRLADGTQQVAFLPQGTIASTEDGGLEVKPGKNRLKITYKSGVFCFSTLQGECNPCVDEDGDEHYWSPHGEDACPGKPWDCNDDVPWANDNAESYCDGLDTNCDGEVDKDWDYDGDGFYACHDEDDTFGCITHRNNLPGLFDPVEDFDTWKDSNLDLYNSIMNYPQGDYCQNLAVDDNTWYLCCDCDDGRDDVYPGAPERCDDIDRDCSNSINQLIESDAFQIDESCQDDADHNVIWYYIDDVDGIPIIYCEQLKRSCAELYPEGTACHNYEEDALCESSNGIYVWQGCGYEEETDDKCFDGRDNDCDGLIDWQDPDCEGQTVFYIGFEDGFKRENCGRDLCNPAIENGLEIVEGAGLRNSKAMRILSEDAQFQYEIEGVPPSNEGSIFFFVKGNSDIWNTEEIVLYEAIVDDDNYLRILYKDSYLKAVIKKDTSEHSISEQVTLGNDWHLIAFTYTYQHLNSNGRLFLDDSLLRSFNQIEMIAAWPAQTANEFSSMHLGTGAGELSGTDLLFDDIFIISEQVEDNYVSTVYEAMLCEELEPCNYVKGDINDDGCVDSQDIALIESAIAGEIEKNQCMDMNNDCRVNADDLALALQQRTGCKYPGLQICVQEESCVNGAPPWYCSADYELIPSCSNPDACGCPVGEVCTNNQCSGGSSPIMAKMPYDYGGPGWG